MKNYIEGKEIKVTVSELTNCGYTDVIIETPRMRVTLWVRTSDESRRLKDLVLVQNKKGISNLTLDIYGIKKKISAINGIKSIAVDVESLNGDVK